ncbi:MAG: glycosyltransferase family 2 protein [Patescibacteria group bacterium]
MRKKDLSIIILNYNGRFWLKNTLKSLKEYYLDKTKYQVEVLVVDNASSDDSTTMIKRSFRWIDLIELKENIGFAAGNNVAIKNSKSKYVMLLNSDTEFTLESNLDQLIDLMEERKDIAVISPKLALANGKLDPACHRGEPTLWASLTYFSGLEAFFPKVKTFSQYHQLYKDINTIHEIDACSGAAMIVRNSSIKKIGLLDERFFMYAEDLDWCKRFKDANLKIVYFPLVSILHHKYKSGIKSNTKVQRSKTRGHFYDTMLEFYNKHYAKNHPRFLRFLVETFIKIKKSHAES